MCLPALALAGIGLALGGAGMQYFGQQKAEHAQTHAFNQEEARQKAFQADENAKFQDSLNSTANVTDPAAQKAAADRRDAILMAATKSAAPGTAGAYLPGATGGNPVVNAEATAAGARANAHTASLGQALAALGGMDDQMQTNNINIGRNGQDIGQIAGFARGSRGVLQSELDAAKQKGGNLRFLGGLAQTIGSAMMSGGMGGAGGVPVNIGAPSSLLSGPTMQQAFAALPAMAI